MKVLQAHKHFFSGSGWESVIFPGVLLLLVENEFSHHTLAAGWDVR